ncbi:MAG: DUF4249 family protein, partial [Candidatus Kapabacteria bacterium]|nr:DUF4249 family protein [Candidatus Kapabacteria bacterium]
CEQNVDVDLPYQERIVVNGFVSSSWSTPSTPTIHITRTLPPLATADTARLRIADLMATMTHQGVDYPLMVEADGMRVRIPVEAEQWTGDTVMLNVRGAGMLARAVTYIPVRPVITASSVSDSTTEWGAEIKRISLTVRSEAGSCIVVSIGRDIPMEYDFPMSTWQRPGLVAGTRRDSMTEMTMTIPYWGSLVSGESIPVAVYATDGAFARYRASYTAGGGPFSSGGSNPWFNVQGDGIGMFVGASVVTDTIRIP